jgi:hypothetical protein
MSNTSRIREVKRAAQQTVPAIVSRKTPIGPGPLEAHIIGPARILEAQLINARRELPVFRPGDVIARIAQDVRLGRSQ